MRIGWKCDRDIRNKMKVMREKDGREMGMAKHKKKRWRFDQRGRGRTRKEMRGEKGREILSSFSGRDERIKSRDSQ